MNLNPMTAVVVVNGQVNLEASGGTAPYTFSVVGPGSVDAFGVYSAPGQSGSAVVTVTDSLGDSASSEITINTVLKILCGVIAAEMDLDATQVYLWNQKLFIPTDQRLYVAVSILNSKHFSNSNRIIDDGAGGLLEAQTTNVMDTVQIDILSRGPDARDRKSEIVMALNSTRCRAAQQASGFGVGRLPTSFVNLSAVDGVAIPYRFMIQVQVQSQISKTKAVDSFNVFPTPTTLVQP